MTTMMILRLRPVLWQLCIFVFSLSLAVPSAFSASVSYTYDTRHRLTNVAYDNGAAVQYSYGPTSNRLTKASSVAASQIYEDGEDGNIAGWDIYDNDPIGATITNVDDTDRGGKVIQFTGSASNNGYRLRTAGGAYWNDTNYKVLEWSMKYSESFTIYVAVQTKDGFRYLYYTPVATDTLGTGTYVHHGLGTQVLAGNWQTFVRDLAYDLKDAQPTNELQAVLGFLIRGNGRVDDIKTRKDIPTGQDSDSDGITDTDEITLYGTLPYSADSDGDGMTDKEELTHWGANWNADPDNDGIINLLDPDADNDSITDGIEIGQGTDPADAASVPIAIVYEDGEDGNTTGWDIYDNDPTGATIANVDDTDRAGKVIQFTGSASNNGYRLRTAGGAYWNDTNFKVLEWSMKYSEAFTVYIAAQTKDGFRYLYYTPVASNTLGTGTYVHHGLGTQVLAGTWQTFVRDLAYDLKDAQPTNELQAVLGFLIRGSGRVDDIKTRKDIPTGQDSDSDGITDTDEISTYGSRPYNADSDGDGLNDKDEITHWGESWNADPDGDSLINLLDPDADNDSFFDGVEIGQGTNPADAASVPTSIVYEDAENGNIAGWDIYDNDPSGATITNVDDSERGKVIEFVGSASNNGYRLRNTNGSYWNDTNFKVLEWSMKYSEAFTVYIAAQTKDGFRYLYYTPVASNTLGTGTYVHHGLGTQVLAGNWQTFVRDLAYDLKDAQPTNELQAVLGFLIRGNGRVDDIKTRKDIPTDQDSDADGITDTDEITLYGTLPYSADSDGDGMTDKEELTYWGANWNADPDGDGIINLLDPDADNDGITDGIEIGQGTDPADAASIPTSIVYEDGEDGNITGWDIYDNDPIGATITNVYDNDRAGKVIQFTGSASNNGYRLRNTNGSYWNDTNFKVLEWSMKYSEAFTVYIAAQTKDGFRYLYYTPVATDTLGTGTYVHHGLGTQIRDGSWRTLTRNLEADLKEAQPDNELESVLGFLIRGNGRVDDVRTRN